MTNLTVTEKRVLNNLSRLVDPNVKLGDRFDEIIRDDNKDMSAGTPVNAVPASAVLNITGVVKHGEKVTIGDEVYEFIAKSDLIPSAPGNIVANIVAKTVKASGTLVLSVQPDSGEKVTIGTKVYTFVPVGTATADGEVSVGADLAGAKSALVAAINGTDEVNIPHPLVNAAAFAGNNCVITALIGGTAGNSIATTETFAEETNAFGAVTLESGADCSAADAITVLTATFGNSELVGAIADDGFIDIMALVYGVVGNDISISETLANGAFSGSAVKLADGVDGTVGAAGSMMVDANYLYICTATNTISDSNWRRISVGSIF